MRAGRPRSQAKSLPPLRGSRRSRAARRRLMRWGEAGPAPGIDIFSIMNIDRQDEQDERLLHEKLARPMIRCGLADARDYKTPDS